MLRATNGTGGDVVIEDGTTAPQRFYRLATEPVPWNSLIASNLGSVGSAANGAYLGSTSHGVDGALTSDSTNKATGFTDGVVSIPALSQFNTANAFSIELWLKPSVLNGIYVYPTPCLAGSYYSEYYQPNTVRLNGWSLHQADPSFSNGNGFYFRLYNTSGDTAFTAASAALQVSTNEWYHVVGTYDGSTISLYVNGELANSVAAGGPFRPNVKYPLTFGARSNGSYTYTGLLDEAAFYTNALSASQVLAHYQAGTNSAPSVPYSQLILGDNPAGYWRLDEH